MNSQSVSSSFSLELKIIRARNICVSTSREVFVRCYLCTTSNHKIRIDSQQISSNSNNFTWNQTFSVNCSGAPDTLKSLKQGTIVFELRCRNPTSFLARISGSKLLARAEMPWNDVVGVPSMEIKEKWVVMIAEDKFVYTEDVKPPGIQIALKVEEEKESERKSSYNCGCMDCGCNYCVDYEFYALGAAL